MLDNNNLSKKRIILGGISFWLLACTTFVIVRFLGVHYGGWGASKVGPEDTFFTLFYRPFLPVFEYIYSPLYVLPSLLAGYLAKRWRDEKRLPKKLLKFILPISFSILFVPFFFVFSTFLHGYRFEGNLILAGSIIQLVFCLILCIIFNRKKEKIIPKLMSISLIFFLAGFIYIAVSAKVASQTEPVLKELSKEAIETKNVSLCKKILEESEKRNAEGRLSRDYYLKCIEGVGLALGDESLCKNLYYEVDEAKCRKKIFLGTTNLCKDISKEEEKVKCIQQIAIETNDIGLCKKILGGSKCFGAIAANTQNFNLCSGTEIKKIGYPSLLNFFPSDCFKEVFRRINNPNICEEVDAKYICFTEAAIYFNDSKLCDLCDGVLDRRDCIDEYKQRSK